MTSFGPAQAHLLRRVRRGLQQIEQGSATFARARHRRHRQRRVPRGAFGEGRRRHLRIRGAGRIRACVRDHAGRDSPRRSRHSPTSSICCCRERRAVRSRADVAFRRCGAGRFRQRMPRRAEQLIAQDGGGRQDDGAAPADFDDIDFVPLRFDGFAMRAAEAGGRASIGSRSGRSRNC